MLEGLTILHVSKYGQIEQGKDIIAIDSDGTIYTYQLKTGDINLARWRSMQGEIQDLVDERLMETGVESHPSSSHIR
jgi:hypothetical protein